MYYGLSGEMEDRGLGVDRLNGIILYTMFKEGQAYLEERRAEIDALNVYPVPDGDTGTNMLLTLRSALKEIESLEVFSLTRVAQAAANGSLMGARGNSGVILSQLLRGMAQAVENKEEINSSQMAEAFMNGVKTAYRAVMKPVEGTMLTVARETARAAAETARKERDVLRVLEVALQAGEKSLQHTPELLPVLKRAGVVDAGGKGLLVILEGAIAALQRYGEEVGAGKTVQVLPSVGVPAEVLPVFSDALPEVSPQVHYPEEELAYGYCTEMIVRGNYLPVEEIRGKLEKLGDSLLVVGCNGVARVHIHTDHPGQVLEIAQNYGSLHQIKIDNMREQHRQLLELQEAGEEGGIEEAEKIEELTKPKETAEPAETVSLFAEVLPEVNVGVVAVAAGEGLANILRSLGVAEVVPGGQSMNPSIEDLVKAIDQVATDKVIVLPNNSNVIMAAEQAAQLSGKTVQVVPTRNFPQAVAAMVAYDPGASLEDNCEAMREGIKRVRAGEVTFAVRDSHGEGFHIKEGQILGLLDGKVEVVGEDIAVVTRETIQRMVDSGEELITLFWGEGVSAEEAEEVAAQVRELYPQAEVEIHYGGQPLYYYLISVE